MIKLLHRFATGLCACSLAFLTAQAQGQANGMPPELAAEIAAIGRVIDPAKSAPLYIPLQKKEPYAGVKVRRDVRYGPDDRNLLDVFSPESAGERRPVLLYVHGGGFVAGNKRAPDSPYYDNIHLWAVRHGMVGVNITYRLAPAATWPSGARIINLSTPGGGLVPNRLLLEYLLAKCKAKSVVYLLDSFAFYSRQWNEDRLKDVRLFRRAPFDPDLARLLIAYNFSGQIGLGVTLDYVFGFSKINNPDRFKADVSEDELMRFGRVHKPSSRDIRRVQYLYPASIEEQRLSRAPR